MDREALYTKINLRVDQMFRRGLLKEVERIKNLPLSRSAKTLIGIPEILSAINGGHSLLQCKELMKQNTRRFAKRQLTWFRREKRIQWFELKNPQDKTKIVKQIASEMKSYVKD